MDDPGASNDSPSHSANTSLPLSPKQLLKMRRPERFSDTVSSAVPALDRALLEYHLGTLTSRNEEALFEEFAKALLQRTVCPNLLPHTGPSGGGDSKVDSETYPVAPLLALSWYVGEPGKASTERWAFAFSAKEDWRSKVRSDVGKVAATQRGYSKAFFVSNQFIRDKVRAEVEDALAKEHGIDVRIFDRTWILDQVFDNKLESIAVDRLQIKTELRRQERKGPRDTERQRDFDAVEAEINSTIQEARQSPALVTIKIGEFAEPPFDFDTGDVDGGPSVEIRCRPFSPHKLSIDEQTQLKNRLFEVVAYILARAFLLRDAEALLTRLFRVDLAPQRALDFTTSFVVVGNVLGHDAKTNLDKWIDPKAANYPLLRTEVWDKVDREANPHEQHTTELKPAPAESKVPPELGDLGHLTHREIQTVSLIREAIWSEAEWRGVVFATAPDPSTPPILALLFENADAGVKILRGWHDELGDVDGGDRLRIAILRNIRRDKPRWYRIVIGNDPASVVVADRVKSIVMVSRFHTMTPDSSENLDRFISAYEKAGEYTLSQAKVDGGQIHLAARNEIRKKRIFIREAWEVGPHDPDCVAIMADDDPIIPQGVLDPPVARTLERIRQAR